MKCLVVFTGYLFIVPKDDGGGRAVIDCSRPEGRAVNNFTSTVTCKFRYLGLDNVVTELAVGDYLASVDIKDAYCAFSIHPEDRQRTGIKWAFSAEEKESYMVDTHLCMGQSSSPFVFSKISDFVVRCALREGADRIN